MDPNRFAGINEYRRQKKESIKAEIGKENGIERLEALANSARIRMEQLQGIYAAGYCTFQDYMIKPGANVNNNASGTVLNNFCITKFWEYWDLYDMVMLDQLRNEQSRRFKNELQKRLNPAIQQFIESKAIRKNDDQKTFFDSLPVGTVTKICSFLDEKDLLNLKSTSKKFNHIINTHVGFKNVCADHKKISFKSLNENVSIYTSSILLEHAMIGGAFIPLKNNFIGDLNLNGCLFERPELLADFLQCFKHLKKVNLSNQILSAESLLALSKNQNLLHVNFSSCTFIDGCGLNFAAFLKNCKKLEFVTFAWANNVHLISSIIVEYLTPNLLGLGLAGVCSMAPFDTHGLTLMLKKFNGLQQLDISDNNTLTDELILSFPEIVPNLTLLSISRCLTFTPRVLSALGKMKYFSDITLHDCHELLEYCLEHFDVLPKIGINTYDWTSFEYN